MCIRDSNAAAALTKCAGREADAAAQYDSAAPLIERTLLAGGAARADAGVAHVQFLVCWATALRAAGQPQRARHVFRQALDSVMAQRLGVQCVSRARLALRASSARDQRSRRPAPSRRRYAAPTLAALVSVLEELGESARADEIRAHFTAALGRDLDDEPAPRLSLIHI